MGRQPNIFCLLTFALGFISVLPQSNANEVYCNVVFILADDLGWGELSCFGQTKFATPNIDRLAREGMRFTNHYSGAPVCAPSRCVLMTGKHLGHAEIRGNKQAKTLFPEFNEGQIPLSAEAITVASVFQRAGYETGAFGKWGLGPVGSTGSPEKQGIKEFFGYNCQAQAHSYFGSHLWHNTSRILLNANPKPGHAKQLEGDVKAEDWVGQVYAPDRMIEQAELFLDANRSKSFFLYLPFIEPHVAMHPPVDRLGEFPADWDKKPYRGENGYLPHPRPRAAYAAMITELDRYVGRILDRLDSLKLTDKTLVIFTSDNGATHPANGTKDFHVGGADIEFFSSTRHLRGYKGSVHEGGIRVPMLARYPGKIAPATVSHSPTYFADWFPTLIEAAGLKSSASVDGESFWEHLTGSNPRWKRTRPMVWVFPEYGGQVAMRSENWKLVRSKLNQQKDSGQWELYDLTEDESEANNVASKHPEILGQLVAQLKEQITENRNFPVALPSD